MLPDSLRKTISVGLAFWILPLWPAYAQTPTASPPTALNGLIQLSYLDLSARAKQDEFRKQDFQSVHKELDREEKRETDRLKKEQRELERQLKEKRHQLESLNKEASSDSPRAAETRNRIHCEILALEKKLREKKVELQHGMPVAFENRHAKLELLQQWPAERAAIEKNIAEGRARQRKYGDVEDIGVREISKDQEKDVKLGEDALKEMKMYSLMPPEWDNARARTYVQQMADRIAANSDVKVPVKLTLLRSEEINAFALPGGYLFVNTGLLTKVNNESELAGVIAHELAHVSGRHGAQLMKRANIANLMYQMAQVAVIIGTGGVGTIGAYYLMQAGFLGLGLVLNLSLLGVNREFEAEADQLGAQYAWKAGYDPRGFISFFDAMASEKGYINSASFFRTHPPFLERIMSTLSEITYLPKSNELALDSSAFRSFHTDLESALKQDSGKKKDAPSLKQEPECPPDICIDPAQCPAGAPPLSR